MPKTENDDCFGYDADDRKFKAAEKALREFWEIGHDSCRRKQKYPPGPSAAKRKDAASVGWYPEKLSLARLFSRRCSRKQLEALIHDAYQDNYPPRWSTIASLFEVNNKAVRAELWSDCRMLKWTRRQLEAERMRRVGKLNKDLPGNGRTFAIEHPSDARRLLKEKAEEMLRLVSQVQKMVFGVPKPLLKRLASARTALKPFTKLGM